MKKKFLVVTTAHRGVFAGYGEVTTKKTMRLENARMCICWSAECKGIVGLAATGPKVNPRSTVVLLKPVVHRVDARVLDDDLHVHRSRLERAEQRALRFTDDLRVCVENNHSSPNYGCWLCI